jgi:hypothetical protein
MDKKAKKMPRMEEIAYKGETIALIVRKGFKQDGISFFSSECHPLQLGAMVRPKKYRITPHIHKPVRRLTSRTQEVLFVQSGEVRVDFYSLNKKFLTSRKLSAGDIVLFVQAGHGIEFLKKTVIFEVKNGPYVHGADKTRFTAEEAYK